MVTQAVFLVALLMILPCLARGDDFPSRVKAAMKEAIDIRQAGQRDEDRWMQDREGLEEQLAALRKEREELLSGNEQLGRETDRLRDRIEKLKRQVEGTALLSQQVVPYLREVVGRLERDIEDGLPFLMPERRPRVQHLHEVLEDPSVSGSDKFRKVMEALFVEAEYGNTVEVYREQLVVENHALTVNVLRLGRLSLFYRSLDGAVAGCFDPARATWMPLPGKHNRPIRRAMEMAEKKRPVQLLTLPLGRLAVP